MQAKITVAGAIEIYKLQLHKTSKVIQKTQTQTNTNVCVCLCLCIYIVSNIARACSARFFEHRKT